MAMQWWGTVNLRLSSLRGAMIHAITGLARADSRLMVRLLTWRMGRKRGVGWVGMGVRLFYYSEPRLLDGL